MKITVIGTGYLGAVHAACMAELGHEVLGVDSDAERVAQLADGRAPLYEPGLDEMLAQAVGAGRLSFGTSLADAARFGDVHFVCVGTPQRAGSLAADTSYVESAIDGLAPHLRDGALVVGKSTVPVGTCERLAGRLADVAPQAELAWNPEFLREGHAVQDTLAPDRLVAGVTSDRAEAILRSVYALVIAAGTPFLATDPATAELAKVAANAFLATKIAFINAMADVCDAAGADVVMLAQAMGHDARIGRGALAAGIGYGGGCLPKDVRALLARGDELGVSQSLAFLRDVDAGNTRRRAAVVDLVRELTGRAAGGWLDGINAAVLGVAFKPGTDDVRDSPALAVAAALRAAGARVRAHDPQASDNASRVAPELDYVPDVEKACEDADVVLHLTEWREYRLIEPDALAEVVRRRVLVDGRNTLPAARWRQAGWMTRGIGTGRNR